MIDKATETKKIERPVITINQGRIRAASFYIMQPVPGLDLWRGDPLICTNPNTGESTTGVVAGIFTFEWEHPPRDILVGYYGIEPYELRAALMKKDPAYKDSWGRLVIVRETV